ncbi:hypothetical protein D3C81_2210240 [compost metagenome]
MAQAGWFAVWSRPDAPAEAQQKIREVALKYFKQPAVQQRNRDMGMDQPGAATSAELMADLKVAHQQQATLLKAINYQPQ